MPADLLGLSYATNGGVTADLRFSRSRHQRNRLHACGDGILPHFGGEGVFAAPLDQSFHRIGSLQDGFINGVFRIPQRSGEARGV